MFTQLYSLHWTVWIFILVTILVFLWLGFRDPDWVGVPSAPTNYNLNPSPRTISLPKQTSEDNNEEDENKEEEEEEEEEEKQIERPLPRRTTKPYGNSGSRKEYLCQKIMEDIYGVPFDKAYPEFLRNPETGGQLEIDIYNDDLKIGLEYNGIQHYEWPNWTGQSREAFEAQIRRDQYKIEQCEKNGVYLIIVPHKIPEHLLRLHIELNLPERQM